MVEIESIYIKAMKNKKIAAYILLPLMEFEFSIRGEESPMLLQSKINYKQLKTIFEICKKWEWTTTSQLRRKGENLYFRLNKKGLKEIFQIAGPFADPVKNEWIKLLLEKMGKKGGYKRGTKKTEEKVWKILIKYRKLDTETLCFKLRILPGTIREALRNLLKAGKIKKIKEGKKFYWEVK